MHRNCDAPSPEMKITTIPSLRVSPELRKQAEALLEEGETLSGFMLDALTRSIEYRQRQLGQWRLAADVDGRRRCNRPGWTDRRQQ